MKARLLSRLVTALAVALLLAGVSSAPAADNKKKTKPPPTKITQTLSQKVYKELEVAQKAFDAKDYQGALAQLESMKSGYDKFNDYEKATYWNFRAAVHYARDDTKGAIEAYKNVLRQKELPDAMRNQTLFALAQLYFVADDYAASTKILQAWFKAVENPPPDAYMLQAQIYYQQQKYKDAEKTILLALQKVKAQGGAPKENWLALLRAVYYELNDYKKSAKVLEVLVTQYPKDSYWTQLAGMYGLLDQPKKQMQTLHVAYVGGMVKKESDLLNLARLYLVQEIPYRAVAVLSRGYQDKTLAANADTLQLYAQALALAKEYEQQIPVLQKLAEMTGQAKHYTYLGQAHNQMGQWDEAAQAFGKALKAKNLDDRPAVAMQLGTALFNAGKLAQARDIFQDAKTSPKVAEAAANWVKFVSSELQRKQALQGG